jgi:hypothetical protein
MRTRVKVAVLALAVAGLMGTGLVAPAGAGDIGTTLDVEKVVVGTPPPGTTFAVQVTCDNGVNAQLVFTGAETQTVPIQPLDPSMICTVTEPGTGGATSVAFACADQQGATECQSDNSIQIFEGGTTEITITNTFDPSTPLTPETPATPVPGTPRFTG